MVEMMKAKKELFKCIDYVEQMAQPMIRHVEHDGMVDLYVIDQQGPLMCKFYSTDSHNLPVKVFDRMCFNGFMSWEDFVSIGSERVL